MTREQAVRLLKGKAYVFYGEMQIKALGMAIEALEKQSPCDICENEKEDCWEMCQFCPAEPKGSDKQ